MTDSRPVPPAPPTVNQVPAELRGLLRWIAWRATWDEGKKKWRKPPYSPTTGEAIGAVRKYSNHFTSLDAALTGAAKHHLDGVGFVFLAEDGLIGIDFDGCIKDNVVHPVVEQWLRWFPSYVERSPSGSGLHVIIRGQLPRAVIATALPDADGVTVECYAADRYFTWTGQVLGAMATVAHCQVGLDKLREALGVTALDPTKIHEQVPVTAPEALHHYENCVNLLRKAPEGRGNAQLNATAWVAARVYTAGLLAPRTEDEVKDELLKIVTEEWRSPHDALAARKTIASGWSTGLKEPLQILDLEQARTNASARINIWLNDADATVPPLETVLSDAGLLAEEEFELVRRPLAKRLGMSADKLGKFVARRRPEVNGDETFDFGIIDTVPWPESITGDEVMMLIAATLKRFIVFRREEDITQCALWTVAEHCYDEFDIFPRLNVTAVAPGCGKTSLLRVIQDLLNRPKACDSLTCAYLYRLIEAAQPVALVVDELDSYIQTDKNLVGVFNSGHKKGGTVGRVDKIGEQLVPCDYATFAPVVYGMIGRPPGPLGSRSLVVRLLKKRPTDEVKDYDKTEHPELEAETTVIRRKIARWVADHRVDIRNVNPDTKSLSNRDRNNWRPLLKVAAVLGKAHLDAAYKAADVPIVEYDETVQIKLLRDIRNIFYSRGVEKIPSTVLIRDLALQRESPWSTYRSGRDPIDENELAVLLRRDLGIASTGLSLTRAEQLNLFGEARDKKVVLRGYWQSQFDELVSHQLAGEEERRVEVFRFIGTRGTEVGGPSEDPF